MDEYPVDFVKQDPSTGVLAQRTEFDGDRAWRVLGYNQHLVPYEDVKEWADLGMVNRT